MPCSWECNRGSGITLAMYHRLQWYGLRKEDEPLFMGYGTPFYSTNVSDGLISLLQRGQNSTTIA